MMPGHIAVTASQMTGATRTVLMPARPVWTWRRQDYG